MNSWKSFVRIDEALISFCTWFYLNLSLWDLIQRVIGPLDPQYFLSLVLQKGNGLKICWVDFSYINWVLLNCGRGMVCCEWLTLFLLKTTTESTCVFHLSKHITSTCCDKGYTHLDGPRLSHVNWAEFKSLYLVLYL